ncbi:hypothetical protein L6R52_30155 [Myxococcota bacterium]|nr:hypothetical protein [Myxococcota bacterium]
MTTRTSVPTICVALVLATLACGRLDTFTLDPDAGAPRDAGTSTPAQDAGVTRPPPELTPVDIIVVVDNSASMADEQANLARNFAAFADQVIGVVDYRLAVITTDVLSPGGERAGHAESTYASTPPYVLYTVDTSGCRPAGVEHGCFRGATPVVDATRMDRATQLATFADNVSVGTCGSGVERAFDALLLALDETAPGGCNEGFLRDDANLVLLFVSDEEDDSPMPIADYVDAIARHKDLAQVRVATIVGAVDGEPANCAPGRATCGSICEQRPAGSGLACAPSDPASCPDGELCARTATSATGTCDDADARWWDYCGWCSFYAAEDCCSALPGARYAELARALEVRIADVRPELGVRRCRGLGSRVSCLVDTICQDSFGDVFARIARELVLPE